MDIQRGNVLEDPFSRVVQNRIAKKKNAQEQKIIAEDKQVEHEQPAELRETVKDLEKISLAFNKKIRFKVDHKSHEVIVRIIDSETNKVVRELPPQELQHLRDRIRETIGILFDEQV